MALQSMTGFGRSQGQYESVRWVWEIRSVNGKILDLRFRIPAGFESLESKIRPVVNEHIQRGNLQISLHLDKDSAESIPVLNEKVLDAVLDIAEKINKKSNTESLKLENVLAVKGVLEYSEKSLDQAFIESRNKKILESLGEAVRSLADARQSEGEAIVAVITEQVDRLEKITHNIIADPSRDTEAIRARLSDQVAKLLNDSSSLDPQRLHQEAAILATKADLQEELDRLVAHIEQARSLLISDEAVGRKLDFLSQEFNRECNTICSKSNANAVTASGLEMKVVIDQFREQIQNIQ